MWQFAAERCKARQSRLSNLFKAFLVVFGLACMSYRKWEKGFWVGGKGGPRGSSHEISTDTPKDPKNDRSKGGEGRTLNLGRSTHEGEGLDSRI